MSRQTQIEFKDFLKAVWKCGNQKFGRCQIVSKRGSQRSIEFFRNKEDKVPFDILAVHQERYVYTKDFQKACDKLGISKEELEDIIDNL